MEQKKDNTQILADKQIDTALNIVNIDKFNLLKNYYDNN